VVVSYKHVDKPAASIKCAKYLNLLRKYRLLNKDSAARGQ